MNTTIYVIIDLKFIWKKEKSLKLKSISLLTFSNIKSQNVENTEKSAHENKTFVYEKEIFRNFLSKIPKRDQKKADDLYFFNIFVFYIE